VDENGNPIGAEAVEKDTETQEVIRNDNFTLLCGVYANPPPQITWYKNEQVNQIHMGIGQRH